ncbi:MAG: hypothetical protein J6D31_00580 [Clostridia bacterium]|nr:hypothetical protein [Clostridia bacterium]
MKAILPYIKKILTSSCICFTLITLFLYLIGKAVPTVGDAVAISSLFTIYLFSLLLALAGLLLGISTIQIGWRVLLHYLASLFAFYVVFIVIAMKLSAARSALIGLLLFTMLYAILMGVYLFLHHSYSKKEITKKPQ